jgi:phosphohistidine phosphatase SixA
MSPSLLRRRTVLAGLLSPTMWPATSSLWAGPARAEDGAAESTDPWSLLRAGGAVFAMRHTLAPGTYDPPGFRPGDCSTQRNLSEEGREQARRLGRAFAERGLVPETVYTSPWCRCIDTATLAFGSAETWAPLASPVGSVEAVSAAHLAALRAALVEAARRPGRFSVWVTHQFVLSDLVGVTTQSGEGLVLRADADGKARVLARLAGV